MSKIEKLNADLATVFRKIGTDPFIKKAEELEVRGLNSSAFNFRSMELTSAQILEISKFKEVMK